MSAATTPDVAAYKSIREQIADLREQAKAAMQGAFKTGADMLFAKYPQMESFEWTQYTPNFNDGDTCEFGVNYDVKIKFKTIELKFVRDNDECECEDDESENEPQERWDFEDGTPETEMFDEVIGFLIIFEEEDLYSLFGDHAQVVVNRAGIEVDTYEHE